MRLFCTLALLLMASPAAAQVSYPPTVTPDDVASAISSATPSPCPVPLPDTLTGTAGSSPVCMVRPDATRPTLIQAKTTTSLANATWSITFDRPFMTAPIYVDARVIGTSDPYLCTVLSSDANGASGKCFQLVATTLPSVATSLLGLVVSPVAAAGANLSVRVVARQ